MKFIYPAIFRKTASGTYTGTFPDLESCQVEGDTLDDAIEKANEAAADWISLELSEDADLPPISDPGDLPLHPGDIVRNISVNIRFTDGWDE
ncbi:MAG: type II toxin-antitoxin system HicB family antitoxin [Eubacteriales bacterium]|nr:type II toxin-antitoxin system HicB family antitoxin [Eubacteriales bacterium]